jgi:hypothetical protein
MRRPTGPGRWAVASWPATRLRALVVVATSLWVLAVVLVFQRWGWVPATVTAFGVWLVVMRPIRRAVVRWWEAQGGN